MTCRHSPNDSSCSSHRNYVPPQPTYTRAAPETPDSQKFQIENVAVIGDHLILEVLYPNCSKCSYEGRKLLVYLDTGTIDALKWREIDPHFKAPEKGTRDPKKAPSPTARFPASPDGWGHARAFLALSTKDRR